MSTHSKKARELTQAEEESVRKSPDRENSIRQYITGLLPSHLEHTVAVRITPTVPTACVVPADQDVITEREDITLSDKQAAGMVEDADADYLVLVTSRAAPEKVPASDQLTADRAHQFALAFHETLHILKTAFGTLTKLLDEEISDEYAGFVKQVMNAVEDGAIEREVYTGDDYSERAANRLRLVRYAYQQTVDDFESKPKSERQFTFGDAVGQALQDMLIEPPSGVTQALVDPENDVVQFATDSDRKLFEEIYAEIDRLAKDIEQIDGNTNQQYRYDIEASAKRFRRSVAFWEEVKPVIESLFDENQEANQQTGQEGQQSNQQGGDGSSQQQANTAQNKQSQQSQSAGDKAGSQSGSEAASDGESGHEGEPQQEAKTDQKQTQEQSNGDSGASSDKTLSSGASPDLDDIDPDEVTIEPKATESKLQDVSEHPAVEDTPDVDELDDLSDSNSSQQNSGNESESQSGQQGHQPQRTQTGNTGQDGQSTSNGAQDGDHGDSGSGGSDSDTDDANSSIDDSTAGEADKDTSSEGKDAPKSGDGSTGQTTVDGDSDSTSKALATKEDSEKTENGQSTFGDFSNNSNENTQSDDQSSTGQKGGADEETDSSDQHSSKEERDVDEPESGSSPEKSAELEDDNCRGSGEQSNTQAGDQQSDASPGEEGNDNNSASQSGSKEVEPDTHADDEETDSTEEVSGGQPKGSNRARRDIEPTPDNVPSPADTEEPPISESDLEYDEKQARKEQDRLSEDHLDLEKELRELERMLEAKESESGSQSSGNGSKLESMKIMPGVASTQGEECPEWDTVESEADYVADTLAKELRLERKEDPRQELTSGTSVTTKHAWRLNQGDPRCFEREMDSDKKRYFLALVLDRSGSMGGSKIEQATNAVAQFAVACERLDIDVAIIDFYNNEARLIKPVSVNAEYVKHQLMSRSTGGFTPLSDALSMAITLAEQNSREALIINMTDGIPDSVNDTKALIDDTFVPVCSLTVATDCEQGNPPAEAEELEPSYEESEVVYQPDELTRKLDRLAVDLGAY